MSTIETPLLIPNRSARAAGVTAFRALLGRDMHARLHAHAVAPEQYYLRG